MTGNLLLIRRIEDGFSVQEDLSSDTIDFPNLQELWDWMADHYPTEEKAYPPSQRDRLAEKMEECRQLHIANEKLRERCDNTESHLSKIVEEHGEDDTRLKLVIAGLRTEINILKQDASFSTRHLAEISNALEGYRTNPAITMAGHVLALVDHWKSTAHTGSRQKMESENKFLVQENEQLKKNAQSYKDTISNLDKKLESVKEKTTNTIKNVEINHFISNISEHMKNWPNGQKAETAFRIVVRTLSGHVFIATGNGEDLHHSKG